MALFNSGSAGATPQPGSTSQKGDPVTLKNYDVEINGHRTTLQLSEEDAKAMGLKSSDEAKPSKEAKAPANKAAPKPSTKGDG